MVWTAWLLLGCRAEYLAITLPPTGLDALSQEDLRRDVLKAKQSQGDLAWYQLRMQQMGLQKSDVQKGSCFGPKDAVWISVRAQNEDISALAMAAQISLAKVIAEKKKWGFCVYPSPTQNLDWWIGDLRRDKLVIKNGRIDTISSSSPLSSDIDYAQVVEHLKAIVDRLDHDGDDL